MTDSTTDPQWAPRLRRARLRRLYDLDAQGIVDDELIEEVAWTLYARCQSILEATAAVQGRVTCPRCRVVIPRRQSAGREEVIACGACGWQTTWGRYHQSFQGKQLVGGTATPAFHAFAHALPAARTAREKMILIDRLMHAYHHTLTQQPTRVAAVNLIEGTMTTVIGLLDGLTYGAQSSPELVRSRQEWRAKLEQLRAGRRRRGPGG
jgi:hypothetical protein